MHSVIEIIAASLCMFLIAIICLILARLRAQSGSVHTTDTTVFAF